MLLRRTHETRPECFKPRDVHEVRTLWHFFSVWDALPPESQQYIYSRLQLFYVVAMRGWTVAARHTIDPDALALFGPLRRLTNFPSSATQCLRSGHIEKTVRGPYLSPVFLVLKSHTESCFILNCSGLSPHLTTPLIVCCPCRMSSASIPFPGTHIWSK